MHQQILKDDGDAEAPLCIIYGYILLSQGSEKLLVLIL